MVNSLENIDKSKFSVNRIIGIDQKIQEELSTAVTGAASTIITSDLTANRAVISNANGSWTNEDEQAYIELDREVTDWIEKNLPYPEEKVI